MNLFWSPGCSHAPVAWLVVPGDGITRRPRPEQFCFPGAATRARVPPVQRERGQVNSRLGESSYGQHHRGGRIRPQRQ